MVVNVDVQILEDCYHWLFEMRDGRIGRERVRDERAGSGRRSRGSRQDHQEAREPALPVVREI